MPIILTPQTQHETLQQQQKQQRPPSLKHTSSDFLAPLKIREDILPQLVSQFSDTYTHLAKHSTDQFLATPVSILPTGFETGRFLAIDCGGTNLRVAIIDLCGPAGATNHESLNGSSSPGHDAFHLYSERTWPIGEHLKMDKAEDLFAWIGDCIAEVVQDYVDSASPATPELAPHGQSIPLGITFSFPMIQASMTEATLMPMGKGFAITSNLNLAKLLMQGYARHTRDYDPEDDIPRTKHMDQHHRLSSSLGRRTSRIRGLPPICIAAITNDTVATLASLAYLANSHPPNRVAMGLIVGTGTNATIPMKLRDLHQSKQDSVVLLSSGHHTNNSTSETDASVVVNTEWTIKGSAGPLHSLGYVTTWDATLDAQCEAPGFQPFEYMTAGRYLGELVRLVIVDYLVHEQNIPLTALSPTLLTRNSLWTTFLATVVAHARSPTELCAELDALFPASATQWHWTPEAAEMVIAVADLVMRRSAALIAAATVGLLLCTGELRPHTSDANTVSAVNGAQQTISNGTDQLSENIQENLLVAYTGGTITYYPGFLATCQARIDALVRQTTDRTRSVELRESNNGGIVGAAVLAGTVWSKAMDGTP